MRDDIYKDKTDISKFTFDRKVVDVFDDMVLRSVPGYKQMIEIIGLLARKYPTKNSNIYDLGCSTGASTMAIASNLKLDSITIFSVDSSKEMIIRCKKNLSNTKANIQYLCKDINQICLEDASLVVLNLTLQFLKIENRNDLIKRIYKSLLPGGLLIISEKVTDKNKTNQILLTKMHELFKKENGYSELEISNKRKSLENFLIPETSTKHIERMKAAGFKKPISILKNLNFETFIAIKD